jgi:hypothetical protein
VRPSAKTVSQIQAIALSWPAAPAPQMPSEIPSRTVMVDRLRGILKRDTAAQVCLPVRAPFAHTHTKLIRCHSAGNTEETLISRKEELFSDHPSTMWAPMPTPSVKCVPPKTEPKWSRSSDRLIHHQSHLSSPYVSVHCAFLNWFFEAFSASSSPTPPYLLGFKRYSAPSES